MSVHFSEPPELLEDLQAEFMELMEAGDRSAFDFALENSDEANQALQSFAMGLMKSAGASLEEQPEGSRAPALAFWALCARQAFLDVVEKEVAPLWAEKHLPKRVKMFEEIKEEDLNQDLMDRYNDCYTKAS